MTIFRPPTDAVHEAALGVAADGREVALYDVVELLPTHPTKRYRRRRSPIVEQYLHHSGRLIAGDPFRHMVISARYSVRHDDMPGFAYTTWVPCWDV